MGRNVIVIHPKDNVAVAVREIKSGERIEDDGGIDLPAGSDIPASHKVAITEIPAGETVVKYGEPIGEAKQDIKPGEWVHTHNINLEDA